MASFNSILSSTRCVCVMFTADWCGPCKIVKPVFEDLAKRSPSEPPVTFVLVDTTAGREIAGHYNVSAVPTIKFFLDSRQQHEIKGADVGELKTQVQLLAMAAFPNHQHMKLKLPTLRTLSDSPVLYEQKPNFSAALAKLDTFKTNDKLNQLIGKTKPHLESLAEPSKLSQEQIITIFKDVHELLEVLQPQQCFPVLDVLKYAVLQPQIAELAAESLNTESNVVLAVLSLGDQPSESLSRPTQLTLLRLLCNCFSSAILASRLLSETKSRSKVTSILVQGLLEENNTVRVAAGSLAFNTATYLRKERRTWVDATDSQQEDCQEREDFEIELCSALLEALEREETLDVAHRLLASLGQLLLFSPHFENGLKPLLEALEAKRIVQSKKNILEKNVEAVKLVREVSELVESV